MKQYLDGLRTILANGFESEPARDKMPATKVYNDLQMRFDLRNNKLPIITTKQMPFRSITAELLCFMAGVTDVRKYSAMGTNVWWDNAYKWNSSVLDGQRDVSIEYYKSGLLKDEFYDLGRIYAAQWRGWRGLATSKDSELVPYYLDQLNDLISSIKDRPTSRYHVMVAWNPAEMTADIVSQPNCHVYFQVTCRKLTTDERIKYYWNHYKDYDTSVMEALNDEESIIYLLNTCKIPKYAILSHLTQRSCDMFLGVPFNITSYSLLTHILARLTNTIAEEFVWNGVNCHIYGNHMEQVEELLTRTPYEVPTIDLSKSAINSLDDIEFLVKNPHIFKAGFKGSFRLDNYNYHHKLSGDLSVGL